MGGWGGSALQNLPSVSPSLCKTVSKTSLQNGVLGLYICDFGVSQTYRTYAIKSAVKKLLSWPYSCLKEQNLPDVKKTEAATTQILRLAH